MPVVRIDNYLDAYRLKAGKDDIHELSGRSGKRALTEFVNRQILRHIPLEPDDTLVDIGCGDGSLLKMAEGRVASRTGVLPSEEEKEKLKSEMPEIAVLACFAQKLAIADSSMSKIICNGVYLYLPSEADVTAALREIRRIAKPGGVIWIGEVAEADEFARYGMYRGASIVGYLWHLLTHSGMRTFLGMARRLVRATFGSEVVELNSCRMFYAKPDHMIAMAEECGLHLEEYFRHQELTDDGRTVESEFRYDYIFRA